MRGLRKSFGTKMMTALLAGIMSISLAGCGSSTKDMATEMMTASNGSMQSVTEAKADYGFVEAPAAAEEYAEAETGGTDGSNQLEITQRKLIKTVDMNVETQEFDSLMGKVQNKVTEIGGYIENMNTYNGSSYRGYREVRTADMTIRIPKDKMEAFLNEVSGISNVVSRSDIVEDVTLSYVDLESHRDALRIEQTRLLELLEQAESIEDIITIEQRLSEVRYQLESMESQLRTVDNLVDYSTINLYIQEVEVYTPVEEETVWERISGGFVESMEDVGNSLVEFGISFVINIPYLVAWGLFLAAIILVVCLILKRSARIKASEADTKQQTKE